MTYSLENVVPWGRTLDEYATFFALTDDDLKKSIIGCGDGPASFNMEATARGTKVVSCDPIYAFNADAIRQRIDETYPVIMAQTAAHQEQFLWNHYKTLDNLANIRMQAMRRFLEDYRDGPSRYIASALPDLPIASDSFDLALSSHFLFLYSEQLDLDFHQRSVDEMLRVAREVRIFPLLDLTVQTSSHLEPIMTTLGQRGYHCQIETVHYEFQRGGNKMLRITRS
ncbi:MAG: SAM-dependent methyltransferase [Anaerolineaceae bacterium]|nr:SAM-dependent methyltransferase [Anaerolineaceae bacterium]